MTQTLLVGIANEAQTEAVADYVARAHPDATIKLLHVIPYTEKKTNPSRGGRDRSDGWYASAREDAAELFELALDHLGDTPGTVETVIEAGKPSQELLTYADEQDVDHIVLGFRKRSPTGKLVFGSTAQDVLLSTTRPVITVPLMSA